MHNIKIEIRQFFLFCDILSNLKKGEMFHGHFISHKKKNKLTFIVLDFQKKKFSYNFKKLFFLSI